MLKNTRTEYIHNPTKARTHKDNYNECVRVHIYTLVLPKTFYPGTGNSQPYVNGVILPKMERTNSETKNKKLVISR